MLRYPVDYYNAAFNKWEYFLVLFIQVFISVCSFSLQLAAAPLVPPHGPHFENPWYIIIGHATCTVCAHDMQRKHSVDTVWYWQCTFLHLMQTSQVSRKFPHIDSGSRMPGI